MDELTEKVVEITGAGAGMGRATARLFVGRGAKMIAVDISDAENGIADELGGSVVSVHCDVRHEAQVADARETAVSRFGRVDAVLNVAGFASPGCWPMPIWPVPRQHRWHRFEVVN